MKGKKILLLGNHEEVLSVKTLRKFDCVKIIDTINDGEKDVCLFHYPLLSYDKSVYGSYHIFGHIHNNVNDKAYYLQTQLVNSFNCGADVIGFTPRTLNELITLKKEGKI